MIGTVMTKFGHELLCAFEPQAPSDTSISPFESMKTIPPSAQFAIKTCLW